LIPALDTRSPIGEQETKEWGLIGQTDDENGKRFPRIGDAAQVKQWGGFLTFRLNGGCG